MAMATLIRKTFNWDGSQTVSEAQSIIKTRSRQEAGRLGTRVVVKSLPSYRQQEVG